MKVALHRSAAPVSSDDQDACQQKPGYGPTEKVPTRVRDYKRWRSIWLKIKTEVDRGKSTAWIAEWLAKSHPQLKTRRETLGRIRKAGEARLLDHDLVD